jgi:hypothetical protein
VAIDRNLLGIYLNDHLAGSTVGRELAKRALGENRDNEFGSALQELCAQIDEDRETLLDVMRRLDIKLDPVKGVAAVAAERVGRLKLNGSWTSYSPLSRVVELEGLLAGVDGKRSMWNLLLELELPELAVRICTPRATRLRHSEDET